MTSRDPNVTIIFGPKIPNKMMIFIFRVIYLACHMGLSDVLATAINSETPTIIKKVTRKSMSKTGRSE